MTSNCSFRPTVAAAAVALAVMATPSWAADPIFPTGSRIGLVPPAGMTASKTFDGFADPSKDAAILITTLPAAAYAKIEKSLDVETLRKQGVSVEKREAIKLNFGNGILLSGRQVADKAHYKKWLLAASASDLTVLVVVQVPEGYSNYSDQVVRAALTTLSLRAKVPEAEELSLLPFSVGDLAGFHIDGVVRGRAILLGDRAEPTKPTGKPSDDGLAPHLLIAALPGGPTEPTDDANFAKLSFDQIGGIKDVQIVMSEPLRIGGISGYQTMADAKDARSGVDLKVVQWLRFGSGGYLQMVGIAPADVWISALSRLRTVRDSVDTK
jgi:hypothetical protein